VAGFADPVALLTERAWGASSHCMEAVGAGWNEPE
jgi:hypothetical protein